MHNLLAIVGPTATGKTAFALALAKKQPSLLISADSRQVYRGMDIVTGKDHPTSTTLYGIDILDPDEENSVAIWYNSVYPLLVSAWEKGLLPIVVGGTGLYVKALTTGIATISVAVNPKLRQELSALTVTELQSRLVTLNSFKFNSMNHSDQYNPRRLIRAIEVSLVTSNIDQSSIIKPESKMIGLYYSDPMVQRSQISQRVFARLAAGALDETKCLQQTASPQALSAIGYRSLIRYIAREIDYDQMVNEWIHDELSYAKRQLTWFRAQSVTWYDRGIIDTKEIAI